MIFSFTVVSAQSSLQTIDTTLFRSINNHYFGPLHHIVIRHDDIVMPLGIIGPTFLGISGYIEENHYRMDSGILSLLSTGTTYGITKTIKYIVQRERPFLRLYDVRASNIWSADRHSFPSGHTSMAFSFATSLSLRYPGVGTFIPMYLWAGFVGYSRIYLGLHYPSDVIAGAVVGVAVALLVNQLDTFIEGRRREPRPEPDIPSVSEIPLLLSLYGFGVGAVNFDGGIKFRMQRSF